jgi:hypothetical protein
MKHNAKTIAEFLEDEAMDFQLFFLLSMEEQGVLDDKTLHKKLNKKEHKSWHTLIACYRLSQMLEHIKYK